MIQLSEYKRSYLPAAFQAADPAEVNARFDELQARPLGDLAALKTWIRDGDELAAALEQERSLRYIATTQNTADEQAQAAYRSFVETIDPILQERAFQLGVRLLASPHHARLDPEVYGQYLLSVRTRQELFRKENIPLQVEESRLQTEYGKLVGGTQVEFQGNRHPLPRMRVYRDALDRKTREGAWRATSRRVLQDRDRYEALFEELFAVRQRVARNAGFADYIGYRFKEWRRPYSPAECRAFHAAVEAHVLPVLKELRRERREKLGLAALRPWDLDVDLEGRAPLRPFEKADDLIRLSRDLLGRVDEVFGSRIDWMRDNKMLDLDSRPGKGPGGYMCELPERRVPFIFMNAAGLQQDVNTMLHEGGHAFHVFETRPLELSFNRSAPIEFAEVASMSMELLGLDFADGPYGAAAAARARREHLEHILEILAWISTVDCIQLELYARPGHTRAERRDLWLATLRRFRVDVDYSGFEEEEAARWHMQAHIFVHAFYYIEYAIAQLGALQVWRNFRKDPARAVTAYRKGLSLGYTQPLPKLFEAAGARFDFGARTVGELMKFVRSELTTEAS
ncbi:MAG: M3 family oligoendopeptidase [Planctomycetaceae bacterium]